jgi:hypothetical protein
MERHIWEHTIGEVFYWKSHGVFDLQTVDFPVLPWCYVSHPVIKRGNGKSMKIPNIIWSWLVVSNMNGLFSIS